MERTVSTLTAYESHGYNPSRNYLPQTSTSEDSHQDELIRAKVALGRRMCEAGMDDGFLGEQIASIDREIEGTIASDIRCETLRAKRNRLLIELADAALAFDAPLPGAEAEFREAREAEMALAELDATAVYQFDQRKAWRFLNVITANLSLASA
jgi:hypothetical protein